MTETDDDTIDLRELVGILRRQIRLILLTVFLGLGAAGLYLFYATPMFTATALVLVDPSRKNILDSAESFNVPSSAENARIESEVEIFQSDTVSLATVQSAGLINDAEFGPQLGLTDRIRTAIGLAETAPPTGEELVAATLGKLRDATSIRRRGLTYLISVSVTSESAENAARIANKLSETYIALQVQSKVAAALGSRDILVGQLESARATMVASDDMLANYIDENIDRLVQESGSSDVDALRAQLLATTERLDNSTERLGVAQAALASANWSTLAQTLGDAAIADLAAERGELERRLGLVSTGSQEEVDLRAGLADIEARLTSRADTVVSSLRDDVASQTSAAGGIRDDIRRTVLGGNLSSNTLAEIFSLQQEADIAQRQYQTLLSRQRDLETQALVQVADSRIVSEALPPRTAASPKRNRVLALALVASIAVGVGLAFLNEYYVGGITSAQQLAHIVSARVGSVVPRSDQRADQLSVSDNVVDAPLSVYSESIRRLRAMVDQHAVDPGKDMGKIVVVVSSIPAEGKSSLSLSLTRTYAQAGRRSLVIDADFRKPALHRYLGLTPKTGFLDYLRDPAGVADTSNFYERDPKSSAGVIMGHGRANMPTDQVLQSATFEAMIGHARQELDVTIIDTPPLIPVVDARYILPYADAVVLAVRYGMTSQSDLREAFAQISDCIRENVPVLTVLTHDETRLGTYRYSGYYADYNRE